MPVPSRQESTTHTSPDRALLPRMALAQSLSVLACIGTTLLLLPLHERLAPVNTVMLFLLTVVLVASRLGRWPSVTAAFLSVGLFDFFFVPPRWSFAVTDVQYLLTFAVMLAVALVISQLTIRLADKAREARDAAARSRALYALASELAGVLAVEQLVDATARFARQQLDADMQLMLPALRGSPAELAPADPAQAPLERTVALLAQAAHAGGGKGHGVQQAGDDGRVHAVLPLPGSTRSRGVLVLSTTPRDAQRLSRHQALLDTLATLVASSLERLHFVQVAHQTQLEMNDERLRGSILSALSHDIRTPLTSLYGLADALTLMPLPEAAHDMARGIRDQAMRLHRMVSNLLDMARLQSGRQTGQLALRLEWQPIEEVIGASIQMLGQALQAHPVTVSLPADLPMVAIDAVLMERVFGNLLENAAKYAPAGTGVHIDACADEGELLVGVRNEGAGFPPDRLAQVFEVFERGVAESAIPGVGLGLSICRAIVEAHGGRIEALNPPEGGALVRFTLPRGEPPRIEPEGDGIEPSSGRGPQPQRDDPAAWGHGEAQP